MEQIELGGCPKCGGPAQFIAGGEVRHVDLRDSAMVEYKPMAELLIKRMNEIEHLRAALQEIADASALLGEEKA